MAFELYCGRPCSAARPSGYTLLWRAARVLDLIMLVGTAVTADAVSLPAHRKNAFRRERAFAAEAQTRVVLIDASITPIPYTPRLPPRETLGLVDIHAGQARFIPP